MDYKSKVVDVSAFLLFEATGDSEGGCFDPAMSVTNHAEDEDDNDDDDDGDAESCSCGTYDTSELFLPGDRQHNYSLQDKAKIGGDDERHEDQEEDGEVVEQKEVRVYKKWRDIDRPQIKGAAAKEEKASSAVPVESNKTMNEKEKNRLFWEACLAS